MMENNISQNIQKCPFCGGTPEVSKGTYTGISSHLGDVYRVGCVTHDDDKCPCYPETEDCSTRQEAIDLWNSCAHVDSNAECNNLAKQLNESNERNGRLRDSLRRLMFEWEQQGKFLDNTHDHPEDRAVGRTYKECAEILKSRLLRSGENDG